MATSTSAMSRSSPSTSTSSRLLRAVAVSDGTSPRAISPAANPANVPSVITGNTLFVPVETGTSGTSPHPFATTRFVPSPPSVMMQPTPSSDMRLAARTESRSALKTGISTKVNSRPKCPLSSAPLPSIAMSGIITTCSTPTASSPARMRFRMLTFSWFGTNLPCATSRRMSLPAAGFAIMPTVVNSASHSYPVHPCQPPYNECYTNISHSKKGSIYDRIRPRSRRWRHPDPCRARGRHRRHCGQAFHRNTGAPRQGCGDEQARRRA